ncbi:hypothetical protein [Intrasporangium flavum]|uniref:hypothetical protein n=1 Tax=Intrasporangium flavum TaxID=1428657 RepID=UPI00096F226E|nr:hypothetical protein [Intrasporangium flavum]
MASAKVAVTVLDHGVEVERTVRRPVRLTPDGYAGVAYAGSVYPLRAGDVVELTADGWELGDCERFLFAGAEIPYAPVDNGAVAPAAGFDIDWYLETTQHGHYLLFNAPERLASQFITALEAADVSIQRWDVSHRPADDGNFFDWFARLRFKGSRDDALASVQAVVSPPKHDAVGGTGTVDETADRLAEAESRLEQLLDRLLGATKRAEAAEREIGRLRALLEATEAHERDHREALSLATRRSADLHKQVVALRRRVGNGPETAALIKSLSDAEELRELALAENSLLLERNRDLESDALVQRHRADTLAGEVDGLMDQLIELQALEEERIRAAKATRPRRGGVVEFLANAFTRLEFILDSIEVLANLESPARTLRALSEIDAGEVIGRDLEGMRGWFEVKNVATGVAGSQRLGRIYYKPNGPTVLVSVHIKQDEKQQRRHIERLRAF